MSAKRGISAKQQRAIEALLVEPCAAKAAAMAKISKATIYRWLDDPQFTAALTDARRSVFDKAIETLRTATSAAAEALMRNLDAGNPADEIRAARSIFDVYLKTTDRTELEQKITALETQLAELKTTRRGLR